MEEQKNKEVKMQPKMGADEKNDGQQKYSYEELLKIADNLFNENRYLKQQANQMNQALMSFNRLDYLLRIVEINHNNRNNSVSFASDFVEKCIDEIQKAMTLPEDNQVPEEGKEN